MLIQKLPINTRGRDFVVGDLHGCLDLLHEFMKHVNFNKEVDRMISVGDLVDRGPKSYETLQLLYEDWFFAVMGNHEDMMVQTINGVYPPHIWTQNGGGWFYDLPPLEQSNLKDLCNRVVGKLPALITVELPENKRFHVLHAELDDDVPMSDEMLEHDIKLLTSVQAQDGAIHLWGRHIFRPLYRAVIDDRVKRKFATQAKLEKVGRWADSDALSTIYCGHSIMRQPTQCWKLTNLDTGAFASYHVKNYQTGLTFTEPLTDKFWTVTPLNVTEVRPVRVI